MRKYHFDFWYKGHQVLAIHDYDNVFHFYIGLTDVSRICNKFFREYLANNVENDTDIKVTNRFIEPYANKELYSMHALNFYSTKEAGIEVALHLCEVISVLDYPEKDYKEFNFTV